MHMKKLLLFIALVYCIGLQAQEKFNAIEQNLFSQNMQNYLGKVNREQFESLVGSPVKYEQNPNDWSIKVYVYNVINDYSKDVTGIRCVYRESDGMLISVRFGSRYYLGYWIDFITLKGYPKTEAEAKSKGMFMPKYNRFNEIYQVDFKCGGLGMQIMDINKKNGTCTINYHITAEELIY